MHYEWEIPQIYHRFSFFDALQISILMIPDKSEFWLHMVFFERAFLKRDSDEEDGQVG